MTIQQMEYIVALDTYRHFVTAAEKCFVTQHDVTPKLNKQEFDLLGDFCGRKRFGHAFTLGGLYVTTSGASHTAQFALAKMLEKSTNGEYNFIKITRAYGQRAKKVRKIFLKYGFKQVYEKDMDETVGDGFYLTMSYPEYDGTNLMLELMNC